MSRTVDERVVEMRFDNKNFESNVATSMSTLDKLKQKLNLSGASKGLEDIDAAAKKVDMSGLSGAAETLKLKFSAMEVVAVTALANITNQAVNSGKRLVSSLSVDQITAGWQKYADKTTSVATLVAQGNAIEDVNAQLDRLNWFTDETSYNFTEMVANIAKFTATGKGLNESVTAMEGIANWAALSGQNAATASRAMYQLSQAMGAGVMRLEDYKSIQNASMDTEEFRKKCIEAAVSLKTLKDNGDGTYSSLVAGASNTSFNISQFARNLTDGMWLTSDVMMKVFNDYSQAVNAIYEVTEEKGMLASEVIDEVHEKANQIKKDGMSDEDAINSAIKELGYTLEDGSLMFDAFGLKAFESAQKARTFRDAIDSVKDAVSTGWMNTFEIIFGDAEKATELWTDLANALWDIFAAGGEVRNTILEFALSFSKPWDSISEKLGSIGSKIDKVKSIGDTFEVIGDKVNSAAKNLEYWQDIVNKVWRGDYGNHDSDPNVDRFNLLEQAGYDHRVVQDLVNKGYQYQLTIEDVEESHKKFGLTLESTTAELQKNTNVTKNASKEFAKLSDEQLEQAGLTEDEIDLYRALEKEADRLGMSVSGLAKEMSTNDGRTLLIDSFKNFANVLIGTGNAIKSAWSDIFNPPGVGEMAVKLYGAIKALNKFSEKVRLTDKDTGELNENGKKLQRTFKGIFAIVDILRTVLGGGLRIAFKALTSILGYFDLNILDVTAAIGDVIVKFRDWFKSIFDISGILNAIVPVIKRAYEAVSEWFKTFKESNGIQNAIKYIKELGTGIKDWWSGLKDSDDLPKTLAQGIINFLSSIPKVVSTVLSNIWNGVKDGFGAFNYDPVSGFVDKIKSGLSTAGKTILELGKILLEKLNAFLTAHGFKGISEDAISGLVNGFKDGASKVWDTAVDMAKTLVQKVKDFLGIHSPSTVFAAIGAFIVAGLLLGLKNGSTELLDGVKDLFNPVMDWISGLNFGSILASVISIGSLSAINKISQGASSFLSMFGGLGEIFSRTAKILDKSAKPIAKVIKSYSKLLNALAFDIKAEGIQKLGETLLMLVGAIIILTFFDPAELWNAVALVGVLALVLAGLAFAMSKINSSAVDIGKDGLNIKSLSSGLIGISVSILLMAMAVKMLGSLDSNEAKQGMLCFAALVVSLGVVIASFGHLVKGKAAENFDKFGKTVTKIAVALLLMSIVVKLLGGMDRSTLIQGGIAIVAFAGIMVGLMAATKLISGSKNVETIGKTLLQLSLAIGVMALVAKMLGGLDRSALIQGSIAIAAFAGIMVGLMAATKLITGSKNVDAIGGTLLKISLAIGVMALTAKLLGGIETKDLIKGSVAIVAFAGIIVGLMAATKLISGSKNVDSIGKALLSISGAIAVMALAAFMLSMISWKGFAKGTLMITAFAGIIVGLMAATKLISGSKNVDIIGKTLMSVAGAIAILAGIAVLLGLVPAKNLVKGTIVVIALSAVMAGLIAVTKMAKKCVGNIVALTAMIAALAGAVYWISTIPSEEAITSAVILGGLMIVMAGVLAIVSIIGKHAKSALKGVLALTLMAIPLLAFVGVLALMSGVTDAMSNVKALTILAGALTIMLIPLILVGKFAVNALMGVLALTLMAVPLLAFIGVLALMSGVSNATANAELLSNFMTAMADVLFKISLVAPLALVADAAITGLIAVMGVVGVLAVAIGALMEKVPSIQEFLNTGLPVLEQLAGSIGTMIGNFVGGIISGIGNAILDLLPRLGLALSAFMVGATPFIAIARTVDSSVVEGAAYMTAAILMLTVADFLAGIAQFLNFGVSFSDLGTQLMLFGTGAVAFFNLIKGVDSEAVEAASNVANMILALSVSELISAIADILGGDTDFYTLGEDLKTFGEAVVGFSDTITGKVDTDSVEAAAAAGMMLAELNKSLSRSGGLLQDIFGEQDFGKFSESCKAFADCMIDINEMLSQEGFKIESEKFEQLTTAGDQFSELLNSLPKSNGLLQELLGEEDFGKFGESCKEFAKCMIEVNSSLAQEGFKIESEKFEQLTTAGTQFSELLNSLPKSNGLLQELLGEEELGDFGESCVAFANCMIKVNDAVSKEGFAFNLEAIEAMKQAGDKMNELQDSLPKTGGWWQDIAGSQDIGDFGEKIAAFGEAMAGFSESAKGVDSAGIDIVMGAAHRMKNLMLQLVDIDTDGFEDFMEDVVEGLGESMADFSEEVEDIDVEAVSVAVTAAQKLRLLISNLVGLDTSGIENFNPETIGTQMKKYSDAVSGMNGELVASSVSSANKLRNLINGLVDLNSSGISKFKPGLIGNALKAYYNSISGINLSEVEASMIAASKLKSFISSLSEFNSSGAESFKKAVDQLALVNISGVVNAFSGASTKLMSAGASMISGLIKGMQSKLPLVTSAVTKILTILTNGIKSKIPTFEEVGETLLLKIGSGFTGKSKILKTAAETCASSAVTGIRDKYTQFYNAGSYLVTGFCNGISENSYKAEAKAKAMAESAVKAAREALDINSPSKVFKEIGSEIPEGFAMGIGMLGNKVDASVTKMASSAINSGKKAMAIVLDALNSDMDSQPTIRPVVDLTDVKTGASAISGIFNGVQTVGVRSNLGAISTTMNAKLQNGSNDDIISAINKLNDNLENNRGDTYHFGNFTYDDGSNINDAVQTLVRAAIMGRRV